MPIPRHALVSAAALALALVALCTVARAQESTSEVEAAWINLSDEHIQCVTFYSIIGVCQEKYDKILAERAHSSATVMLERAVTITARAKMKFETVDARLKLYQASMLEELGKDCRNETILLAEYGKTCRTLFENPDARELQLIREQLNLSAPTPPR
jgi:hypothetical protein